MTGLLIAVAALWGAATGVLVPRAAYRFSVPEEENWREACPGGHPFGGPAHGYGRARCGHCIPTRAYGPSTPLVCLVTALLCAGLAAATDTRPEVVVWLLSVPVWVLLAAVDLRVRTSTTC
ncbi:Prepilin peptidase OS=Streptomyces alboniger OX=132473 GN=CP975_20465 PE=3 SV=1 [Streptomyces alboniger]